MIIVVNNESEDASWSVGRITIDNKRFDINTLSIRYSVTDEGEEFLESTSIDFMARLNQLTVPQKPRKVFIEFPLLQLNISLKNPNLVYNYTEILETNDIEIADPFPKPKSSKPGRKSKYDSKYQCTIVNWTLDITYAFYLNEEEGGFIPPDIINPNLTISHDLNWGLYLVKLDGCLKLGYSDNIQKRIANYKTSSNKVELLAKNYGTPQIEKMIHRELGGKGEKYPFSMEDEIIDRYFEDLDDSIIERQYTNPYSNCYYNVWD